jgi:hypothetical protein
VTFPSGRGPRTPPPRTPPPPHRAGQPRAVRVTVTSPQTEFAIARGGRDRPAPVPGRAREPKPTPVDHVLLRRVLGAQRRAAMIGLAGFVGALVLLPVVLNLIAPAQPRLAGVPVVWLALGTATYPVLVVMAARHVRRVEAVEATIVAVYTASGRAAGPSAAAPAIAPAIRPVTPRPPASPAGGR